MESLGLLKRAIDAGLVIKVTRLLAAEGRIEVGEEFHVRFQISNRFSSSPDEENLEKTAGYRDVQLHVSGTPFAEIVGGDRTLGVAEYLGPGDSARVDVVLEALDRIPDVAFAPEMNPRESFIEYRLTAAFDYDRFFRVDRRGGESTQIHPAD